MLGPSVLGGKLLAGVAHAKGQPALLNEKSRKHDKLGSDLREQLQDSSNVSAILQLDGKPSGQLNALLASNGIKIRKHFDQLNSFALELPASVVEPLASFPEVSFISIDSEVRSFGGHVARTSGADNVRPMSTDGALDGSGIGIAILDSGIYGAHTAFTDTQTGQSRIVVNLDFTGEGRTDDPYGHGTHVAAAAAGNGIVSRGEYIGIAPRAKLLNLRVLNERGTDKISNILSVLN